MRRHLALGLVALLVPACSDEAEEAAPAASAPSVTVVFGPAAETNLTPYPSNRYTVADPSTATGLRVDIGAHDTRDTIVASYASVVEGLNEMDGFSTTGGVILSFSAPIDVAGVATESAAERPILVSAFDEDGAVVDHPTLVLLDVDPDSPERGKTVDLVARFWAQPADGYYLEDEFTLVAQPVVPLRPATRYLFVATDALRAADGGSVGRSEGTAALLAAPAEGDYAAEVQGGLDELEASLGLSRARVVAATSFTTATIHDATVAMAEARRAAPPPVLTTEWEIERPLEADGRIRFRAVYEAPEYRRPSPNGQWLLEDGAPVAQKTEGLEVFLAIAHADAPVKHPVVIYGHGLGGDKDGCWGTAERLGALDAAVFAIDSPEHGSRAKPDSTAALWIFSFFGIDANDQSFDIRRARDNFRQMSADQLELVRLIGTLGTLDLLPAGAPDGEPDLDVSRILYIGHSFGSVQGPAIFALAPEIEHAVWNVGGDGLTTLLRDSGTFSVLVNGMRPPATPDGALGRFFAVTQALVDPGDPLNYARYGTLEALPGVSGWKGRDVLLQEVIADNIVPNSTSEALARAAGLELMDPIEAIPGLREADSPLTGNLASGATGAIVQFDEMDGGKKANHGELIFSPEARAQYVEFLRSGLETGRSTIPAAYP